MINKQCKPTFTNPNGFNPKWWGSDFWRILHEIAWHFPIITNDRVCSTQNQEIRLQYKQFYKTLVSVLPCYICCKHYNNYITKGPRKCILNDDVFENRKTLTTWLFNIHNCVNKGLKKKLDYTKYSQIKNLYRNKNYWNRYGNKVIYYVLWNCPVVNKKNWKNLIKKKKDFITFFTNLKYVIPNRNKKRIYAERFTFYNNINLDNISRVNLTKNILKILDKDINKVCKKYIVGKRVLN